MARDNVIETILTVKDESSAKVGLQLELFSQAAGRAQASATQASAGMANLTVATAGAEVGFSKATRAVRNLALPLVSELSPAMGQVSGQIAQTVTSAALLGGGFAALAGAAGGVAAILGGQLVQAFARAKAAQKEFSEAIRTGGMAETAAEIKKAAAEIERLADTRERLAAQAKLAGPRSREAFQVGLVDTAQQAQAEKAGLAQRARERAAESEAFRKQEDDTAALQLQDTIKHLEATQELGRLQIENRIRVIELDKAGALARLAAMRQVADAEGALTISAQQRAAAQAQLITATRDVELKAIADVAAARKALVGKSDTDPRIQAEQRLQIDREAAAARKALDDRLTAEMLQNAARLAAAQKQAAAKQQQDLADLIGATGGNRGTVSRRDLEAQIREAEDAEHFFQAGGTLTPQQVDLVAKRKENERLLGMLNRDLGIGVDNSNPVGRPNDRPEDFVFSGGRANNLGSTSEATRGRSASSTMALSQSAAKTKEITDNLEKANAAMEKLRDTTADFARGAAPGLAAALADLLLFQGARNGAR